MPESASGIVSFTSKSVEQTSRVGVILGKLLVAGDVICLSGNLGAGKTALTRGIGQGWGALEAVTSPTFTLIHEHRRVQDDEVLYHVDCYRLEGSGDAWGIGLEDLLHGANGPVVIEWPENIKGVLPANRLWIAISIVDDTRRRFVMEGMGAHYETLVQTFRQTVFGV